MYYSFKGVMTPAWTLSDKGIEFKGSIYKLEDIESVRVTNIPSSALTNGVIQVKIKFGQLLTLGFAYKEKNSALEAIEYIKENYGSQERKEQAQVKKERDKQGLIYDLAGVRGRSMKVYEDRCVIKVQAGLGSLLTGNASDGEKTIYYSDCIGVQFKESGLQIGYLQLETASSQMNNKTSNFFTENSFTFDTTVQSNEHMSEVADYVRTKVAEAKSGKGQTVVNQISSADEIKKFKELLDMGVITQEEFDAKKKQILGL